MIQVIRAYLRKDHANTFIKRTIKKKLPIKGQIKGKQEPYHLIIKLYTNGACCVRLSHNLVDMK